MMNAETITLFRNITEDFKIPDSQIAKFLKWGNDDIQQALNYYYRKLEKQSQSKTNDFFKSKKDQRLKPKKEQTTKQSLASSGQKVISQKQKIEIEEVTVFDKMKKASVKQKKTEEFIARVRRQYQLPINGKRHPSDKIQNSEKGEKSKVIDQYEVQEEFKCADYLGSIFNNDAQFVNEDDDEFEDEGISDQLKTKLKQIQIQGVSYAQLEKIKASMPLKKSLSQLSEESKEEEKPAKPKKPRTRNNTKSRPKFQMASDSDQKDVQDFQFFEKKSQQMIHSQKRSQQMIKSQKIQQKVVTPNQVYLGEYLFQGFKTDVKPFHREMEIDSLMDFKYYVEPEKKTKSVKASKGTQKSINMRICWRQTEICRVQDHEARILVPLIIQNMIRVQVYLFQLPTIINTFAKIRLRTKVYLKKKALTEPVVETFDGHSEQIVNIYKNIKEELSGLLDRLSLEIKTYPLIKSKSRFVKTNQKSNKQRKDVAEFQKRALQFQKKQQQLAIRKLNDPFFKVKQMNISQMMKSNNSNSQSRKNLQKTPPKNQQNSQTELMPKSEIKRKIIEINTIEENKYAQLIDLYQQNVEPIFPKNNFKTELYHYQAVALAWMLRRQGKDQVEDLMIQQDNPEIHPLWTEYALPQDQNGTSKSLYFNQLTSQMSLTKPVAKFKCKGGILADEMGLGKTVMMAALISAKIQKNLKKNQAHNLVIVPLTLLSQWQSQIKKHTKNVSVVCYYTAQRHRLIQDLGKYHVVITTYGTVSHEFTKMSKLTKTGLYKYKWKRIILDEAHYIKGRIIQTSKAVYSLEGECRWCLTGTPIQNGLNDLFSLLHFIRYTPWSEFECWSKYIIKPHDNGDENVYEVLRTLLKRIFLRRTKNSKDENGKSIIELPPKHSKIQVLEMSAKQRQFYDMIYESTKAKIDQLDKLGIITARYMQVLQILVKLRQVCCHPVLFKSVTKFIKNPECFEAQLRKFIKKRQAAAQTMNDQESQNYFEPLMQGEEEMRVEISQQTKNVSQNFLKQTIEKINKEELQNCLICLDDVEQPVITCCLHIFCKTCMIRQIQESGTCATCRKRISKQDFIHLPRQNRFNVSLDSKQFVPSTKMLALMEHVKQMKPDDKAVVFSQFLGMMDLLEHDLKKHKIRFVRMEGSTPQKQRAKIISEFSSNPQVKIFLVSLKTAGVGLNLIAANKVFLMDPWWNPGVEDQAIERVHRIGQKKEVQIVRFIMDKTIQMRMVELNTEKKNLSQLVLSHRDNEQDSKLDKLRYLMEKY